MIIDFNLKGAERKPLVKALGEILNTEPQYLGVVTKAYKIGDNSVTLNGELVLGAAVDGEMLLKALEERGFTPVKVSGISVGTVQTAPAVQDTDPGLTVEVPKECVNVENLEKLISAKGSLIKKALGVADLPINASEKTVLFPWFGSIDGDSAKAYIHFISALCEMSKAVKNISAKEK